MSRIAVNDDNFGEAVSSILDDYSESGEEESDEDVQTPVDPNYVQCGGPCNNRHPLERIVKCEAGHPFCFDDAKAYTQTQLGKGVPVLKCMNSTCDKIFPGTEVLRFIDLKIFVGVPKERLEIMIERVGVKDLVEICPYCVTVVVCGPLSQNTIVNCTNTNCSKKSCRKCKKAAHGRKTCEEACKESLECGHCLRNYPPREIVRCEVGHPFCLEAAREYAKTQLGKGVPVLKCLDPACNKIFPGVEVLRFIDLKVFAGIPRERLEIMIDRVGVKGLVEICPNCTTVVSCGALEQKTEYTCTNPECRISTCRKCQKEGHRPKSCEGARNDRGECGHCSKIFSSEEIVRCEVGHPFCLEAAREYAKTQLGKGVLVLKCLDLACDEIFPGKEVLRFIDLKVFAGIPRERLEAMIDRVGLRGLVEICPNCTAVVACGKIEDTTLYTCTNQECQRSICRKCQKEGHGAKTCEEARKESNECSHCSKSLPPAEIVRCEAGHPLCLEAAREYAQGQLGKGVPVLSCLDPACDKIFPGTEVLRFIDLRIFAGIPRERLEIMIVRVGVSGLVEICSNCTTVVACGPIEEATVFICTNSDCNKSTCRKCQKDAHGALTCEEHENGKKETYPPQENQRDAIRIIIEGFITQAIQKSTLRAQIESIITDAIYRRCNNCKTQLLKQNGYNKLTCHRCGKFQCYLCAESIVGAQHFNEANGKGEICREYDQGVEPQDEQVEKPAKELSSARENKRKGATPTLQKDPLNRKPPSVADRDDYSDPPSPGDWA